MRYVIESALISKISALQTQLKSAEMRPDHRKQKELAALRKLLLRVEQAPLPHLGLNQASDMILLRQQKSDRSLEMQVLG